MARGKESKYIKVITGRDEMLLKQLSKTGLTDRSQANIFCGITQTRLQKLENTGYIRLDNHCVDGINTEIIRLDKLGKSYCKKELDVTAFANAKSNHLTHDLKVSMTYYSLPPEVQETWKHEYEILKEIYMNHPELKVGSLTTCIDASVVINNERIAIEIVGHSYSQDDIDLKENIAMKFAQCSSIEFVR